MLQFKQALLVCLNSTHSPPTHTVELGNVWDSDEKNKKQKNALQEYGTDEWAPSQQGRFI